MTTTPTERRTVSPEELRRAGVEVIEVDKAPAGYVDPLPVAQQRAR